MCRTPYFGLAAVGLFTLISSITTPASAGWPHSASSQIIVNSGSEMYDYGTAPDGSGGIIVVYHDYGPNDLDIRAQRFDRYGNPDWEPGGIPVCVAPGAQRDFQVVANNDGGCFVIWNDNRLSQQDIYYQKITSSGQMLFSPNGSLLFGSLAAESIDRAIPDGTGGCILAYKLGNILQAQRFNPTGSLLWPGDTVASPRFGDFTNSMISDGSGGAYLGIQTVGIGTDVAIARVTSTGSVDGRIITENVTGNQLNIKLASRGNGTVLACWADNRLGTNNIFTTEYNGALVFNSQHQLNIGGQGNQFQITQSIFGDPIIAFGLQVGTDPGDIRVGRVNSLGALSFSKGITGNGGEQYPVNLQESATGLIRVAYTTSLASTIQILVSQFSIAGDEQWTTLATPAGAIPSTERGNLILGSLESLMVFSFQFINSASLRYGLVRINANGQLGGETVAAPTLLKTTEVKPARISLSWVDNSNNETGFTILRTASSPLDYQPYASVPANTKVYTDLGVVPGSSYRYAIVAVNELSGETGVSSSIGVTCPLPGADLAFIPSTIDMITKKTKATLPGELLVTNNGDKPTSATTVAFILSADPTLDTTSKLLLFEIPVPALQPDETVILRPGLLPPKKPGKKQKPRKVSLPKFTNVAGQFLVIQMDPDNINNEAAEGNNLYVVPL